MAEQTYISAQEAETRIVALYRKEHGAFADTFNTAIDACQTVILDMYDNAPKDVIAVVRCGECKYKPHWDEQVSEEDRDGFDIIFPVEYKCPCQCDDGWYSWIPDDDWFCAGGEREVQE